MEVKNKLPDGAPTVMLYVFMVIAFLGTVYGWHNDWTTYVMVIPWWAIGGCIPLLLFKDCKKNTAYSGVLILIIMTNLALLLVHRDTDFVVGRLVSSTAELMILMIAIQYPAD